MRDWRGGVIGKGNKKRYFGSGPFFMMLVDKANLLVSGFTRNQILIGDLKIRFLRNF
jgi:hypothetical protein